MRLFLLSFTRIQFDLSYRAAVSALVVIDDDLGPGRENVQLLPETVGGEDARTVLDGENFRIGALHRTNAQGVVLLVQHFDFAGKHQVLVGGDDLVKTGNFGLFFLRRGSADENQSGQNQKRGSPRRSPNGWKSCLVDPRGLNTEMGRKNCFHDGIHCEKCSHEMMLGEARRGVK